MKNLKLIFIPITLLFLVAGCGDSFLNTKPKGTITEEQLKTPENADKLVIAAYAAQANDNYYQNILDPWPYGDLRGGDAYKGGAGIGDNQSLHIAETFSNMTPIDPAVAGKWEQEFLALSRVNTALKVLREVDESNMPKKTDRIAEMRFLRGHRYFWLKANYKHVPYIDETVPQDEYKTISNDMSSQELWDKIIADFRFAVQNLPQTQQDVGRPTKYAAKAYLAKTLLYAAYEQNDQHEVVNKNTEKLNEVVTLTEEVINNPNTGLNDDFGDNFTCDNQNSKESIWAIQFSVDDGDPWGNVNGATMTNYPMNEEYGCCGYHSPSQNLVNAFRTENGLPDFDTFNQTNLRDAEDVKNHTIDSRLLHSVAMDGLPYKYKPGFIYDGETWPRQSDFYGPFLSMKETVIYDSPCYQPVNPWKGDSKNRDVIRLDDVILWQAEALIQLGRHNEARPLINQIRQRAKESTDRLVDQNGDPTGNFDIDTYSSNGWTKQFAWKALKWERRLEFALEGFRAYDLLRWGIMGETMREYWQVEKTRRSHLKDASFTEGRDEYLPIPKRQIDLSEGLYKQNPGY